MSAFAPPRGPWVAAAVAVAALLWLWPAARPQNLMRDFNAFYCAGAAIDRGADPYRAEPLGACERAPRAAALNRAPANLSVPAPLPPYALAPFALLARLPYDVAAVVWTLLSALAFAFTIVAMRRLTGVSTLALVAAFGLVDGLASLTLGQIAPVAIAAIVLAVAHVEAARDRAAAVAAALATIEPHLGLPACIALFVFRPKARLPLSLAAALFAGVSFALLGAARCIEYVREVLPAHAMAEIVSQKQFSLTYVLHRAGVADAPALMLGNVSYVAMVALGIALAPRLAKRLCAPGLLVAVPCALAVFGGPFVHVVQLAAALPAAFLLFARAPQLRTVWAAAIAGLAIPFVQFASLGTAFPLFAAAAAAALAHTLFRARPLASAVAGAATYGFASLAAALVHERVPDASRILALHYDPAALAQASWDLYVRTVATSNASAFDLAKLPNWLGLAALVAGAIVLAVPNKVSVAAPREEKENRPLGRIAYR
ncbi:MAG: DUF2029 domain-containing protein [Candidatus Eremiobacteraeota bacterium]|nr:DUF2029 domain-containing protein [Candidatus Eremiobacteraeota bacterium]MBC5809752.1 DUF2029 domain-containing protein [Candidatus Eremiobacteraeota bacterium]